MIIGVDCATAHRELREHGNGQAADVSDLVKDQLQGGGLDSNN